MLKQRMEDGTEKTTRQFKAGDHVPSADDAAKAPNLTLAQFPFPNPSHRQPNPGMDSMLSSCINPCLDLLKEHVLKHLCLVVQVGGNVEALCRRAGLLEARRQDVLARIRADEPSGRKPTHEVEAWLSDAEALLQRAMSIRGEYDRRNCLFPGASSCSLNCFSNHHISSRAAEELSNAEAALSYVAGLGEITAAVPPPPAQAMPTTAIADATGYEIRGKLEAAIDFLRDDAQGSLGLWGMGGVGKTTLLEHVNDSLAKDPSYFGFDRVVFLVASRDCTVEKIQELLVKKLGLTDSAQIFSYLSSKSFVLLLDDLWDPLDLKRAGVPLPFGAVGQSRRKLIVTTRFQQVCLNMDIHTIVEVECLSTMAARRLFRDKVGEDAINSHPLILKLADEVADECGGLPLALITIGRALARNQTVQVWQNAARLLRDSKLSKVPGTVDPLLLLKFSYDHLKDPAEQQCFLLCALWPEDGKIRKLELIECWMGHGLLGDGVGVYDQGYTIIDSLLKACLLQRVEPSYSVLKDKWVKLHDVIRDMALWIARDCGKNENKWMVLKRGERLPHDTRVWSEVHKMSTRVGIGEAFPSGIQSCPKLSTLILAPGSGHALPGAIKHFSQLEYLDLTECIQQHNLPIEICSLTKLEYLKIDGCFGLSSLPNELKNLRNLKYLIAPGTKISHLPEDLIANLVSLLYLNLTPYGSISQSTIINDLNREKGRLNALGISVSTTADIKKLSRHDTVHIQQLLVHGMEGIASLRLLSSDVLGRKHMHSNLRWLGVSNCAPTFEELVVDEEYELTNLDRLELSMLLGLKEVIWKGVEARNVLPNLRIVYIEGCPLLEHVTWIVHLPFLEHVDLGDCENMKHMVCVEALKTATPYELGFPSLRTLNIWDLPNLDSFCSHGVLAFPLLEWLCVSRCARLTKLSFQSPPSLCIIKGIYGDTEWWDNLEMDDDTRNFLQPFINI